jgi:PncC family amidohydrolase
MPDEATISEQIVRLLTERGATLAVAESCTGGLIADLITDVSGSSRCFLGGIVPYHNDAKTSLLGVDAKIIEKFGSVSGETALAMAQGVLSRFGADIGVAVTGIAGPGGGTPEKPVGLTFLAAVDAKGKVASRKAEWTGNRRQNKRRSALTALFLVEELLEGEEGQ